MVSFLSKKYIKTISVLVLSLIILPNIYAESGVNSEKVYQDKINWLLDRFKYQDIRGGTTKGLEVELDPNSPEYFLKLQSDNLKKIDKDRMAILSMAGGNRVVLSSWKLSEAGRIMN